MDTWSAEQYLKFSVPRLRPGLELLARVPLEAPARVLDLGCGTGDLTRAIAERYPKAHVTGLDSSGDMLAKARQTESAIEWIEADLSAWQPRDPVDLVYANAVLHWVPDHPAAFAHLAALLQPAGALAVQMPQNFAAPSHALLREVASAPPWKDKLVGATLRDPVADPPVYYGLLADLGFSTIDIWETEYLQVLRGADAVLEWVKGTTLTPVLAALDPAEGADFLAAYGARLRAAYPTRSDGSTLYPFRRLFLVAAR